METLPLSYPDIAQAVLACFANDLDAPTLKALIHQAYDGRFDAEMSSGFLRWVKIFCLSCIMDRRRRLKISRYRCCRYFWAKLPGGRSSRRKR